MEKKTKKYWLLLVIAWSIHNLEEALTMSKWWERYETKLPISNFVPLSMMQQSLPIALIIATLALLLIAVLAVSRKWDNRGLGIVLGICLVNAALHILTSVVFLNYSPGVITALLINLPLSIFLIRQLFKNNLLKNFSWLHIFVYGVVGLIIAVALVWIVALS